MEKQYGFGIDLGGTTCKLGLFCADGTLLEKWEIPTDTGDNGVHILPDIAASVEMKLTERRIEKSAVLGLGIGVPGAVDQTGVVHRCVNLGWGVVNVQTELSNLIGLPVHVANDASIAALGEAWKGSGAGMSAMLLITLGTGIGGGIVLNGRLWNGYNGAAGEFGHMLVNPNETELCSCGKRGCLEQYASATGLVRCMRLQLQTDGQPSRLREVESFTAKDVIDAAKDGDALALAVVQSSFEMLGAAAANLCNALNPEAVILGGGVSKAGEILLRWMRPGFEKAVFHACKSCHILLASLGNDAGIYGGLKMVLESGNTNETRCRD